MLCWIAAGTASGQNAIRRVSAAAAVASTNASRTPVNRRRARYHQLPRGSAAKTSQHQGLAFERGRAAKGGRRHRKARREPEPAVPPAQDLVDQLGRLAGEAGLEVFFFKVAEPHQLLPFSPPGRPPG